METAYTVSSLTDELKALLETSYRSIWVEGEISGCKVATSGHVYFSLKDERALLSCVCWRSTRTRLGAELADGNQVVALGRLTIYPPRGQYQLTVEAVRHAGIGALQQRFEELKRRLEAEGLFAQERKRPLPRLPRRIGVVTSPTGAAIRDFLKVLHGRFPHVHVMIVPAQVQGAAAAGELVRGIQLHNRLREAEVIVLTRGGGSIEDLWPFNEEVVARAIAASELPVVSAVGHEVDFTIADFVADARAATPTAAAELLIGRYAELLEQIESRRRRLVQRARQSLELLRERLDTVSRRLERASPAARVAEHRQTIDLAVERFRRALERRIDDERQRLVRLRDAMRRQTRMLLADRRRRLEIVRHRLEALAPRAVLARGFSICTTPDGRVVRRTADVAPGDTIGVGLADGDLSAAVTGISQRSREP